MCFILTRLKTIFSGGLVHIWLSCTTYSLKNLVPRFKKNVIQNLWKDHVENWHWIGEQSTLKNINLQYNITKTKLIMKLFKYAV